MLHFISGIDSTHCLPVVVVSFEALSGSVLNVCVSLVVSLVHTLFICEALSRSVLNVCLSPVVSIVHTVYLWWLFPVRLCQEVC